MSRRVYKNPPIEEALCEFRFENAEEWDPMFPLMFMEKIKGSYPGKPVQRTPVEANLNASSEQPGASFLLKHELGRLQFPSKDGKALVAIGQNVLSTHVLRPYPRWEKFRPRIEEALKAYAQLLPCNGVRRIGLRYINKIVAADENNVGLGEYFIAPPAVPDGFPSHLIAFIARTQHLYDDLPIKLIVTFTDIGAEQNRPAFLLDIDLVWEWREEPLPIKEALDKVDILRERERDAFEMLITDRCREMFDATQA